MGSPVDTYHSISRSVMGAKCTSAVLTSERLPAGERIRTAVWTPVLPSGQAPQHGNGLFPAVGLAEDLPVQLHHRIRTDDRCLREPGRHLGRLLLRQAGHQLFRREGFSDMFIRAGTSTRKSGQQSPSSSFRRGEPMPV